MDWEQRANQQGSYNQSTTDLVDDGVLMTMQTHEKAEFAGNLNQNKTFLYQTVIPGPSQSSEAESSDKLSRPSEGYLDTPSNLDKQVNIAHERWAKGEKSKLMSWDVKLDEMSSVSILKLNELGLVNPNDPRVQLVIAMDEQYKKNKATAVTMLIKTEFDVQEAIAKHGKEIKPLSYEPNEYVMGQSAFKEAQENADAYLVLSEDQQNLGPMYENANIGDVSAESSQNGPVIVSGQSEAGVAFNPAQAAIDNMTATPGGMMRGAESFFQQFEGGHQQENQSDHSYGE